MKHALVDLAEKAREAQLAAENRKPREYAAGLAIIESDAIKQAHRRISKARVEDTLFAESSDLFTFIEKFRKQKAEQTKGSIANLCGLNEETTDIIIRKLREIGFLREVGASYKIPMLYRDGLGVTQGKASQ